MAFITRHGSDIGSVFDLLGRNENDLTAALGFTLANSPRLTRAVLNRLGKQLGSKFLGEAEIAMEVRGRDGRTDLEIRLADTLLVFEAKRGWLLPQVTQLSRYVKRIQGNGALVTLSQASRDLAASQLPGQIRGVPVVHLSWIEVLDDVSTVRSACRGRERLWLEEFSAYLKGAVRVRNPADSRTYCVALNRDETGGKRNLSRSSNG